MRCMSETAGVLGHSADCQRNAEYEDGARKAYNYLFFKDGTIDADRQAKLVRQLTLGLLENEVKTVV